MDSRKRIELGRRATTETRKSETLQLAVLLEELEIG